MGVKAVKRLFLILALSFLFISCGITEGDSIEDCQEIGYCDYLNKSVKNEGSDLALALMDQLLDDSDDIIFSYSIDPGGDSFWIEYTSNEDLSHTALDILIPLMKDLILTVSEYYEIDDIRTNISIDEDILVNVYFDDVLEIDYIAVDLEYASLKDDSEQEIMNYLEIYADKVKLLLDYEEINKIWWYGSVTNGVYLDIEDYTIKVTRLGTAKTERIDAKINEILEGYDYILFDTN